MKTKEITLSIIIPVYNVYSYLEKCITSVINQVNNELEILLINDGSTDNSDELCVKMEHKYSKYIKYYSKSNSGLSDTRNVGINKSNGKYIMFLDSDDYIENNLTKIIQILKTENPDILYFGYNKVFNDDKQPFYSFKSEQDKIFNKDDFIIYELSNRNLSIPACFGIYRKKIIIDNNIMFEKGILHEDERWSPIVLLNSNIIYTSSLIVYNYIQRDGSITHKKDKTKNGLDLIDTCYYLDKLTNKIEQKKIKKLMRNRIAMVYMKAVVIGNLSDNKKIDRFFPIKRVCFIKDYLKAFLFMFSTNMYIKINKKLKEE